MLAREAMASAAVALYAAAVLPNVPPQLTAQDLALGLFRPVDSSSSFVSGAVQLSGQCTTMQELPDTECKPCSAQTYAVGVQCCGQVSQTTSGVCYSLCIWVACIAAVILSCATPLCVSCSAM